MSAAPKKTDLGGMSKGPSTTPGKGLGRGFESLLANNFDKNILLTAADRVEKIPVEKIQASPFQPRRHFDEQALAELASSIKQYGVVQPLVVTPAADTTSKTPGMYTLIAGERRWRASQLAGLKTVPAIIRSSQELEQLELAIIENVQRVDLSPLDQAVSIERLHSQFSQSYETIAGRLGKAVSTVNNIVRLLQLPDAARDALVAGHISEGHARAILSLKANPPAQATLLASIVQHGWNVRQAERYATAVKQAGNKDNQNDDAQQRVQTETPATKAISQKIGVPVNIRRTAKGGKLELAFKTDEELEKLLHLFD